MTLLESARRALPMTFVIYVIEALFAAFAALPLGSELARARLHQEDPSSLATLLESSDLLLSLLRSAGIELTIGGAALLLLTPWLRMSWLLAVSEELSIFAALERGGQLFTRAWIVSLGVLLCLLLGILPFAATALLLHLHYDAGVDARTHDLALVASLSPVVLVLFGAHVLHDLAHARAISTRPWASLRASLRSALRPRILGSGLTFALLGWAVLALPSSLAASLSGSSIGAAVTVALGQSCVLAKLFVRSAWLACAHREIAPLAQQPVETMSRKDEA